MAFVNAVNNSIWETFESCLVPPRSGSPWYEKIVVIIGKTLGAAALLPVGITTSVITTSKNVLVGAGALCSTRPKNPQANFDCVLKDSRLWRRLDPQKYIMNHPLGQNNPDMLLGVGTDTYQDSGFTNCPDAQWSDWESKVIKQDNKVL